jgi:hypothetical protein
LISIKYIKDDYPYKVKINIDDPPIPILTINVIQQMVAANTIKPQYNCENFMILWTNHILGQ